MMRPYKPDFVRSLAEFLPEEVKIILDASAKPGQCEQALKWWRNQHRREARKRAERERKYRAVFSAAGLASWHARYLAKLEVAREDRRAEPRVPVQW